MRLDEVRKPVLVKAGLHRQLKRVCFNCDVKLQDLADAIIESVLKEETKLASIVEKLKKISWRVAGWAGGSL